MGSKEQGGRKMNKDKYLQRKDEEIKNLKDDYWQSRDGEGLNILFEMIVKIDDKTTYIAKHPKRAEDHYSYDTDAKFVRTVRKSLGLTQEAFAYRLGVTATTVNRWENQRMPLSKEKRSMIERAFNFGSIFWSKS